MRWYGKLFGFIAGWLLLRHPAGAVLGLALGHAFDADWFRANRLQRGIGAGLLEVEMWRFQAVAKEGLALQVELIHSTIGDSWRLVRIFEQ